MKAAAAVVLLSLVIIVSGCSSEKTAEPVKSAGESDAVKAVRLYFDSWQEKDYPTMYGLASEGWRKLEPTASTQEDFAGEIEKYWETADSIKLISAVEKNNDGRKATVEYIIEMGLFAGARNFSGTYTLKNTAEGWKLLHPYGKFADE